MAIVNSILLKCNIQIDNLFCFQQKEKFKVAHNAKIIRGKISQRDE